MDLNIDSIFSFHPANSDETKAAHEAVRQDVRHVAELWQENIPSCPERTLAIRHLQQAMMFANSAIAQNGVRKD